MTLGPIEIVVLGFPDSRITGDVRARILDLVDRNIIRVLDALIVRRAEDGTVTYVEFEDLLEDPDVGELAHKFTNQVDLLSAEDAESFADQLAPGSSAVAIVYEHTWMIPVREAVLEVGGVMLASIQVPTSALDEVLTALDAG